MSSLLRIFLIPHGWKIYTLLQNLLNIHRKMTSARCHSWCSVADQKSGIADISFENCKRKTLIYSCPVFPSVDAFFILAFWILSINSSLGHPLVLSFSRARVGWIRDTGRVAKKNTFCWARCRKVFETKRAFRSCVSRKVKVTSEEYRSSIYMSQESRTKEKTRRLAFPMASYIFLHLINEIDCLERAASRLSVACELFF